MAAILLDIDGVFHVSGVPHQPGLRVRWRNFVRVVIGFVS